MPMSEIIKDRQLLAIQLQALLVFEKAYKVGEDIRNMADFMNIVRELDVFVEDIDKVRTNLHNKIGRIHTNSSIYNLQIEKTNEQGERVMIYDDDPILVFNSDFSL